MKIYINRETNLIENKKLSSIEYNIEDNLVYIFNSNKLSDYDSSYKIVNRISNIVSEERKELIVNSSNCNIYTDEDEEVVNDPLDEILIYGDIDEIDESNTSLTKKEIIEINNDNYDKLIGLNADEIMKLNYQTILENSIYDNILYNFLGDEIDIESDFSICNKYNILLMPTGSVIIKLNLEISDVGKIRNKKINEDILFGNIPEDISIYINNIDINEIEDTTFCGKVTIKLKNETDHPIMINQPYILYND